MMAAGEDRQHGGNEGYDDLADVYYTWDSTVNNYANIRVGDAIAVWDKRRLLGVSVIEEIRNETREKPIYRCPMSTCGRSSIKERKTRSPRYRCQQCKHEFDEPIVEVIRVTQYQSRHDAAWTPLEDLLAAEELRRLCESPKSQLSMRPLNWSAFSDAVTRRGGGSAVERVLGRALGRDDEADGSASAPQGHTQAVVRVRRGQRAFRQMLLRRYREVCALTGEAPDRVLEAGHLYSYAKLGEHHEHGGLLLRRDVHRLFDDGGLAIDPTALTIDVAPELSTYPQYASLHGKCLRVTVMDPQVEWLEKHWREHRGAAAQVRTARRASGLLSAVLDEL